MMSRKFVKIMCIILAALMALSGIAVLFTTFAIDENAFALTPVTGESNLDTIIPIAILVVAVVAVVVCLVLPKMKNKGKEN